MLEAKVVRTERKGLVWRRYGATCTVRGRARLGSVPGAGDPARAADEDKRRAESGHSGRLLHREVAGPGSLIQPYGRAR